MALLKTGEVAGRAGVSRQIIHIYTTMGLIKEERKTAAGHRLFSENVLKRVEMIRELVRTEGYTLRDVKEIFLKQGRI